MHFSAASDCLERFVETKPIHFIESSFIKHFSFLSLEPRAFRSKPAFPPVPRAGEEVSFANVNITHTTNSEESKSTEDSLFSVVSLLFAASFSFMTENRQQKSLSTFSTFVSSQLLQQVSRVNYRRVEAQRLQLCVTSSGLIITRVEGKNLL